MDESNNLPSDIFTLCSYGHSIAVQELCEVILMLFYKCINFTAWSANIEWIRCLWNDTFDDGLSKQQIWCNIVRFQFCRHDSQITQILLGLGASISIVDQMGRTALHHASGAGDLVSIMALLDAGADVNQQDYSGKTPLHWASMNEHDSTSY